MAIEIKIECNDCCEKMELDEVVYCFECVEKLKDRIKELERSIMYGS